MEILYVYIWNIIVVNIKGKHNFKHFYYIHIVEIIPTQKESTDMETYRVVSQMKRRNLYRLMSWAGFVFKSFK